MLRCDIKNLEYYKGSLDQHTEHRALDLIPFVGCL